ncbi:hypothetical protein HMSSN036_53800 [Paenibacillus macerans]|nr:hypothetical protein HMSSN036_53800 [Paenibacillus macerans]
MKTKRKWLIGSWVLILTLVMGLAGCSQGADKPSAAPADSDSAGQTAGSGAGEPVTITYSQWGTAEELQRVQELLDQFMEANPNITVKLEGKDWGSYWDGLTANAPAARCPMFLKPATPTLKIRRAWHL